MFKNLQIARCFLRIGIICALSSAAPARSVETSVLTDGFTVPIMVDGAKQQHISRRIWGLNLDLHAYTTKEALYAQFGGLERLRQMGVKFVRLPGGCYADGYDWKTNQMKFLIDRRSVVWPTMPINLVIEVAADLNAELLYQVNVETKGLPNPCGWKPEYPDPALSEAARMQRLLDDIRQLLRSDYGVFIRHVELGNEPWDKWTPQAYGDVALRFASEIKAINPSVQIHLVGYPTGGNNQINPSEDPCRDPLSPLCKRAHWNLVVSSLLTKTCNFSPCFAAVTDHPYGQSGYNPMLTNAATNFKGMSAHLAVTNFASMMDLGRKQYAPKDVSWTEWNLKCWSTGTERTPIGIENASFEAGGTNWEYWEQAPNIGTWQVAAAQSSDGRRSAKLVLARPSGQARDMVQVYQRQAMLPGRPVRTIVWINSPTPQYVQVAFQQSNAGAHQWASVGSTSAAGAAPNTWVPLVLSGKTFADTTEVQLLIRVTKTSADWLAAPGEALVYVDHVTSLANESFEQGGSAWGLWQQYPNTGHIEVNAEQAHTGTHSLKVSMDRASGAGTDLVQANQSFSVMVRRTPGSTVNNLIRVQGFVHTSKPAYVQVILQQTNGPDHQWQHVAQASLTAVTPNQWQGFTVAGHLFDASTDLQVVLRISKTAAQWAADPTPVVAYFDDISVSDPDDLRPPIASVSTVEHGLFVYETLLGMAQKGVAFANYHAFGPGDCGLVRGAGNAIELNPQGEAFELTAPIAGGTALATSVVSEGLLLGASTCTALTCLPGKVSSPYVSAVAAWSEDGDHLYLFLTNRHPHLSATAQVSFANLDLRLFRNISTTTLRANDYTENSFVHETASLDPAVNLAPLSLRVPAISAVRVELAFQNRWTITTDAICASGRAATAPLSTFYINWPPNPFEFNQTPFLIGQQTLSLVADHRASGVGGMYVGMMAQDGSVLSARAPLPSAAFDAHTYFNPPTPMVHWYVSKVPSATYHLTFTAPPALCR